MSNPEPSPACWHLGALIETLGEDAPNRVVTHAILDHLATCPACCRGEAALTRLLADYRFTARAPLPEGIAQRLVQEICGSFRPSE